jgi:hypothetical protein
MRSLKAWNLGYSYDKGLDLKPSSQSHGSIRTIIHQPNGLATSQFKLDIECRLPNKNNLAGRLLF